MTIQRENNDQKLEAAIQTGIIAENKNLHTALPGKIISFNPDKQTATVQPGIKSIYFNFEEQIEVELPEIIECPVAVFRGGGFCVTYPIQPGDECLIIFCERSIDRWFQDGPGFVPMHMRTHDYSDAIIFPCIHSQKNLISDYNAGKLQIRSENNNIVISLDSSGKLEIRNNTESLLTILADLLTALSEDGVDADGFKPLEGQGDYSDLLTRLSTFI